MGVGISGFFEISIFATKFNLLRGQPKAYPFGPDETNSNS